MTLLTIILALVLDQLLGEPKRFHPLVGFGWLVTTVEQLLRRHVIRKHNSSPVAVRFAGTLGWLLLAPLMTLGIYWLLSPFVDAGDVMAFPAGALVLFFCIGNRSLAEHARAVAEPLCSGDLPSARQQLSRMVSRETDNLDKEGVAKAAVESVLENASDAVLAPIFWFVVAGIPGVLLYRFTNTLDAMWGYKNQQYRYFGWAAARMDDVLNWLPARCCALSYAIVGNWNTAIRCWQQQAPLCGSPNAGPVMSSGAGAMGVRLGGVAYYHGEEVSKPELGSGRTANSEDIERAIELVRHAVVLWVGVIALVHFCTWGQHLWT
jgi:adenosylcobinamide-phosphate synthase